MTWSCFFWPCLLYFDLATARAYKSLNQMQILTPTISGKSTGHSTIHGYLRLQTRTSLHDNGQQTVNTPKVSNLSIQSQENKDCPHHSTSFYNTHSFQISAATIIKDAGIPDTHIQMLERWPSSMHWQYIRMSPSKLAELASVLAQHTESPNVNRLILILLYT